MREILFRGKRVDNGEWVEGNYVYASVITRDEPSVENIIRKHWIITINGKCYEVDPKTVGQYTGLTDKNGKRIFEGDILRHHVQGNILVNRGVVVWDDRNGRWAHKLNTLIHDFYMHNPAAFKVIGNIHDNPELLEVQG